MANPTYGADAESLEDKYFPGRISESQLAGPDQAQSVVDEVADDVAVEVRNGGVVPESITEETAPLSYKWLTKTILLGAAAEYGRRSSSQNVELWDTWSVQFEDRMKRLRFEPQSVLEDAPGFSADDAAVFDLYR